MDKKIVDFLIRAKRATYAGKGAETASSRIGSHDLVYREGDLMYYDTYLGGEKFAGEEALTDGPFSGDFLKEALLHVPEDFPYRGPAHYENGDYTYTCSIEGEFDWFQGKESIAYQSRLIYECYFHGGMIR